MARRIDSEFALSAHTALQVMFCRAQIASNRDRLRVGVVCDLEKEQFLMVTLGEDGAREAQCLRVFEPRDNTAPLAPVLVDDATLAIDSQSEDAVSC